MGMKTTGNRLDPELPHVRGVLSTSTLPARPDDMNELLEIGGRAIHAEFIRAGGMSRPAEERWPAMPQTLREAYIREAAAFFRALATAGYEVRRKR